MMQETSIKGIRTRMGLTQLFRCGQEMRGEYSREGHHMNTRAMAGNKSGLF